jgi:hypothetical protein
MKRLLLPFILLLAACRPDASVSSPDGHVSLRFSLSEEGRPAYSVDVDGTSFIGESSLGLDAKGQAGLPASGIHQLDDFHLGALFGPQGQFLNGLAIARKNAGNDRQL